jgi:hypothetical protein
MRDWQDERWVKLYVRDEPEWLVLPWWARGLFDEILKRVDPAGLMRLGKAGRKAIAASLSSPWDEQLADAVQLLIDDGAIRLLDCDTLLSVPNFVEAQEAKQSDKARQQKRRIRQQAMGSVTPCDGSVTESDQEPRNTTQAATLHDTPNTTPNVTLCDTTVTPRDASVTPRIPSVTRVTDSVTRCHVEKRREEKRDDLDPAAPVPSSAPPTEPGPRARAVKETDPAQVFVHWQAVLMPGAKKTTERINRIKARLKEGFTVEQLCQAIDGAANDDWLMGRDPKSRPGGYRDLKTVLRDAAQVERLIQVAAEVPAEDFEWTEPPPFEINDPPGTVYIKEPPPEFEQAMQRLLGGVQ